MASQVFWKGFAPSQPPVLGTGPPDMSLQKNVAGQNVTFALINAGNDAALTGLGSGFTVNISKDGGSQAGSAGTKSELGQGAYNYAPTQAETNANCVSFMITATGGVPENIMCLTGGLHKNVAVQHVTFEMFSTSGVADPSATVSVFVSKDGGAQASGSGTITNLGSGQYDYAPTQAETNGVCVQYLFTATGDVIQSLLIFTVP